MDGIVIFILFIVFSIIRTAVESQKRQASQKKLDTPPVREVVQPPWQSIPQASLPQGAPSTAILKKTKAQEYSTGITVENAPPTFAKSAPPLAAAPTVQGKLLRRKEFLINKSDWVRGVVFSELLGPPRVFKNHRRR